MSAYACYVPVQIRISDLKRSSRVDLLTRVGVMAQKNSLSIRSWIFRVVDRCELAIGYKFNLVRNLDNLALFVTLKFDRARWVLFRHAGLEAQLEILMASLVDWHGLLLMLVLFDLAQELVLINCWFFGSAIDSSNSDRAVSLGHHETLGALFLIIGLSIVWACLTVTWPLTVSLRKMSTLVNCLLCITCRFWRQAPRVTTAWSRKYQLLGCLLLFRCVGLKRTFIHQSLLTF